MKISAINHKIPVQTNIKTSKLPNGIAFGGAKDTSKLTAALVGLGVLALSSLSAKDNSLSLEQKAKKVFSGAFMRDDLSDEETVEIMNRYREIKKIKDDDEYAKAMFEEAKKNFGFKDADIKLILSEGKIRGDYQTLGKTNPLCGFIEIAKNQDRYGIADSIHHEMRHMKQSYLAFNANPSLYVNNLLINNLIAHNKDENDISRIMTVQYLRDTIEGIKKYMKVENPSIENIPENKRNFAMQLLYESRNYVTSDADHEAYMKTLEERDAYKIGRMMGDLIKEL